MILTLAMLEARNACYERVEQFRTIYPTGIEVTVENVIDAAMRELPLWWFAAKFLSGGNYGHFIRMIEAPEYQYMDECDLARDEHNDKVERARREVGMFDEVEWHKTVEPIFEAYQQRRQKAYVQFWTEAAPVLVQLIEAQYPEEE